MNMHDAGGCPSVKCCGDLPISVILPLTERKVLGMLVIAVVVILKVTFENHMVITPLGRTVTLVTPHSELVIEL